MNDIESDYGFLITGNLEKVKDINLKMIMEYGTKYRMKSIETKTAVEKWFTTKIYLFKIYFLIQKIIYGYNLLCNFFFK